MMASLWPIEAPVLRSQDSRNQTTLEVHEFFGLILLVLSRE